MLQSSERANKKGQEKEWEGVAVLERQENKGRKQNWKKMIQGED